MPGLWWLQADQQGVVVRTIRQQWEDLLPLAIALVVGLVLVHVARHVASRRLKRPGELATGVDDLVLQLVRATTGLGFVVFTVLWAAPNVVDLAPALREPFRLLAILALLLQLAFWGNALISWVVHRYLVRSGASRRVTVTALTALGFAGRLVLFVLLLLLALSNIGINVTALVTGLGIGGVAVALALQNVLTDLLGALSIVLVRPFLVGDTIKAGDFIGTVEYVGLRSTRIRNLPGEELFVPNSYLLSNAILNISRLSTRRVSFQLRVALETSLEQLERIPALVQEAVQETHETRFDRAHLKTFGDWGFEFEVIYFVLTPDYTRYMDARQSVNLGVLRRFETNGIRLGAPAHAVGRAALAVSEADENGAPYESLRGH